MTSFAIFSFFGGVMLLLYGMRLAGDGLQRAAGARLRGFLLAATGNRVKGVIVGAAITALLQSSSATTVILVGLVGSGLMSLSQTMGVILGADIGTTLTVQIITFRVYAYAIPIVGTGILLRFLSKGGAARDAGLAILGAGFIFLALKILMDTFSPLAENPLLAEFLLGFSRDPAAGIIIAALATSLLQSSAATLAIAITFAHSGLLTLDAAVPVVLGANIGTCVSAAISSMGAPPDAKRVALAHVIFKVTGVIIVLPLLGVFTRLVSLPSHEVARQVAYAHTFFNIGIAAMFLPFTGPLTTMVQHFLPLKAEDRKAGPRYLDPLVLAHPPLALGQATREALRLADTAEEMLKDSIEAFRKNDFSLIDGIQDMDNDVDLLDREIKLYLTKLAKESLTADEARREFEILTFTNNMENMGDVIDKNLMELARKKLKGGFSFSAEGMKDIVELHLRVMENFKEGVAAFASSDSGLSRRLLAHKARIAEMEKQMREAHIDRLHRGLKESIDTSSIHLDVLANLKRINSYACNIAYGVLESGHRE
ncbi:MAG: Na/Pi cotransporter family protein [Deltaproteobacteria bacterium]|nr:Na/Pi cotransporter family protein [Deltaproteobacteria bacterium]